MLLKFVGLFESENIMYKERVGLSIEGVHFDMIWNGVHFATILCGGNNFSMPKHKNLNPPALIINELSPV